MSLSGMFNTGHDVGGFFGPVPDPELLVRWVQSARVQSAVHHELVEGRAARSTRRGCIRAVLPIVRDWLRLRYRLLPYLYSLYARAARFARTDAAAAFLRISRRSARVRGHGRFPRRPESARGAGRRARRAATRGLPARGPGGWIDFWSGEHHMAGATVIVDAPLERIPLFAPAGAILPVTDTPDMRRKHDEPSRALRMFPGRSSGESTFTLYEDDGITLGYRDGDCAELHCSLSVDASRNPREGTQKQGRYALPYATLRIVVPPGEKRRLELAGEGVELVA